MAFISLKEFLSGMGLGTPEQFEEWSRAWKVAVASGSQESLLGFICRECGLAEDVFLQKLAQALNWPYLDLPKLKVPAEARNRISTKVAFQHGVLPIQAMGETIRGSLAPASFPLAMSSFALLAAWCAAGFVVAYAALNRRALQGRGTVSGEVRSSR